MLSSPLARPRCLRLPTPSLFPPTPTTSRAISNSPYGRTHVWKRRAPTLPNPLVPKFPMKVIRADGTAFTHWTTSPRSLARLTRDTTNSPTWNTGNPRAAAFEEEGTQAGRIGRFARKFEELGAELDDAQWMEDMSSVMKAEVVHKPKPRAKAKGPSGKK